MAERAEALASKFEASNNDLIATVAAASDEQWAAVASDEGWSVGTIAHHVGGGYPLIAGLVGALASGADIPALTMDQIDQSNKEHAVQFASVNKDETLEMLRTGGAAAAVAAGDLSDEQLDRSTEVLAGAPAMTTEQAIEGILIGGTTGHLASIKKTI